MIEALTSFLASKMSGARDLAVVDLREHTEGFSLETFSFRADWHENGEARARRFVIRREPAAGLLEPYDLEPQFMTLDAIADTPVRFPRVFWYEHDPSVLGAPFYVMEWVDGEVPLPVSDEDGSSPFPDETVRLTLGRDYVSILSEIHKVDLGKHGLGFLGQPDDARDAARRAVDLWAGYTERARLVPMPVMTEALVWLRGNLPVEGDITLVHGDYRTGNFICQGNQIAAFLDWEMVHIGDPMEDLAWSMSRIWRGESPYAGYLVDPEDLQRWYLEAGGSEIRPQNLHFYDVLAGVKMAAIMLTGIKAWHDGRTKDMRMAMFDQQLSGLYSVIADSLGIISVP